MDRSASVFSFQNPESNVAMRAAQRLLDKVLALPRLQQSSAATFQSHDRAFLSAVRHFDLDLKVRGFENLAAAPAERGVLILANHPRGLLDGICLGHLVHDLWGREDFKIIANSLIRQVLPVLDPYCLPVENMGLKSREQTALANGMSTSRALSLLRQKGVIILTPSGQVSEWKLRSPEGWFRVADVPWRESGVELVKRTKATVIPVHISGANGAVFQLLSFLGANFKRLWLFREFMNSARTQITLTVGKPIVYEECVFDEGLLGRWRQTVYALGRNP